MQISALQPTPYDFVAVLKVCASKAALVQGKLIHAKVVKRGLEKDLFVASTLVDMYAKCGSPQDAHKVFDKLPMHDVVLWSTLILGYAECGQGWRALQLYKEMQQDGIEPNKVTFLCLLKACTSISALDQGKLIHTHIIRQGLALDLFIGTTLVNMYAKCGSLEYARNVFDNLLVRNVVSWSAIIAGYAENGYGQEALQLFLEMQQEGIDPDQVTYVSIFKACASTAALCQGKVIHVDIMKRGLESDIFLGSALIDMYAKCNSLKDAHKVFDKLPVQSIVSWSTMIAGYAEHGQGEEALHLFGKMIQDRKEPSKVTFICIIKACSIISALDQGKLIHIVIIKQGFEANLTVQNALVDMYVKCGSLEDAHKLFENFMIPDVVSWSAMIAGYAEYGHGVEALQLYDKMQREGTCPNEVTFVLILNACSSIAALRKGKLIHVEIMRQGFEADLFVGNALVDMYSKCDSPKDANWVFKNLPLRDIVSWNSMIAGHANHCHHEEALELFKRMIHEGTEPNQVTFVCVVKACSSLAALDHGKLLHAEIIKRGLQSGLFAGNSLVDMYAKCGSLDEAHMLFDTLPLRDVITWNAMVLGCAEHGHSEMAQQYFKRMLLKGIKPDDVTCISILSCCSHAGLVWEGYHYISLMMLNYGLVPTIEHYACIVDLLGRAGCLNEAEDLILRMPLQPNSVVWAALLGSCAKYENLEVGRRAFTYLVEADCTNAAGYALMSNIYAVNHTWQEAQELNALKKA